MKSKMIIALIFLYSLWSIFCYLSISMFDSIHGYIGKLFSQGAIAVLKDMDLIFGLLAPVIIPLFIFVHFVRHNRNSSSK